MIRFLRPLGVLATVLVFVSSATAHCNMLLPDKHSVKKGEEVTFTYQWGHPYEHQLFDAPKPTSVYVLSPDGKKTDLTKALEKATVAAGDKKEVTVYRFHFKPSERGDYVFVLQAARIWMEEEGEFLQDRVQVVLHVQTQHGWDGTLEDNGLELAPLTRPYGLQPGMVFQAQAFYRTKNPVGGPNKKGAYVDNPSGVLAKALVEIERYNAAPPKELPPDEVITRAAKTDPNGVVTCTLSEPGWWCIAVQRLGIFSNDGQDKPICHRAILWVFVDDKSTAK